MGNAVDIRTDFTAEELRRLARKAKDIAQSRRLLSLAAVLDGMNRTEAARIGGMDRQTLRDWVHRFNREGPDGLKDRPGGGKPSALSAGQRAQLAAIVEAGPDPATDVVATALLDRLLHHAVVIQIEGASYRLRQHADLIPEHVRSKASITPPPALKRRGRPPGKASTDHTAG